MPPAKVEPWTLELSAYGFGGTASGMLRSTSLDRSRYQIPGAMGCSQQLSFAPAQYGIHTGSMSGWPRNPLGKRRRASTAGIGHP